MKKRSAPQTHKLNFNKGLFYVVLTLVFLGLVAIADSSAPQALANFNDKYFFFKSQAKGAVLGVLVFLIFSRIKVSFWEKISTPFFFFSVFLLILVLIPSFSYAALGARRWISIGPVNFQPSEIIKFALALYFAKLAKSEKGPLSYFIPLLVVLALIMLQPDLGTALSVSVIGLSQIFVSGISLLKFFAAGAVGLIGVAGLILFSPYRRDRLMTFLEATSDPLGKGYHIRQVLLALGSGGFFGVGIGASRQKYLFLPEASTDSIFAIIAEEIGLFGSMIIIGLFAYFIYQGFRIAKNAPDKFSQVLAIGLTSWIGGQVFLNIGSMVALVPLTGVPLPFFSYGSTSLVMVLVASGILLNISSHAKPERRR